jgi:hypothetical protein
MPILMPFFYFMMQQIKDFPSYSITDNGKVYSHNKNKFIYLNKKSNGYIQVNLYKLGKCKTKLVHRLVAEAFILNTYGLQQVNHMNGNKCDNRIVNLEWVNAKENTIHSWGNGLSKNTKKQREIASKTHSKIVLDMQNGIYYDSVKEASKCLGIYYPLLKNMLNGATKNKTSLCYV